MLDMMLFLQSYGFFRGGGIGDLFNYWEQAGVFSYLLPLLLIFCLVFVILSRIKIFEDNKAVNGIIALVVGLLAMQFDMVPFFFAEIFPRVGVGLSIILAILILVGLFLDPNQNFQMWGLFGVGVIIFLAVLINTFEFTWGYYLYYLLDLQVLSWVALFAIIGIVAAAMSKKKMDIPNLKPILFHPYDGMPK